MKYEITLKSGNLKIRATAEDEFDLSTAIYHMRAALDEDVGEPPPDRVVRRKTRGRQKADDEIEKIKEVARRMSFEITPDDINPDVLPEEDIESFRAEQEKEIIQPKDGQTLSGIIIPKAGKDF